MKKEMYYVSANRDNLDLGMKIEAENPYMAAVYFVSEIWNDFNLDDVIVTEVEEAADDK
ncbi:TPA: hypothetical protein ACIRGN_000670 [Streptococcus suis]|uniref:Uncharacterized protein n=1 Tax=Streptococcus suis TaxID=1307 RepID=A0AAJ2PJ15_STRSU|nr:hypothetical protein [Streptococcus suis]MDW8645773.1 hypothetical protein [Streptococcus suis]BCK44590.1 hypothetical protein DAT300_01290 [Streptococcus suis]HEL1705461.1 hypothetical protein [Streptococcus suis]HEL1711834.1 hypothetical protein [Streptococcus suis]HEL1765706.1 hypothetical protein [Streptococcus suis]